MTPDTVARIVERRDGPAIVHLLRAADVEFDGSTFEQSLADVLRAEPELYDLWGEWSGEGPRPYGAGPPRS